MRIKTKIDLQSNFAFTVGMGLLLLTFIVVMELRDDVRPVYHVAAQSLFPHHVAAFVNHEIASHCDIKKFRYVPASEVIDRGKDHFVFSCWISIDRRNEFSKDGFVRVTEYNRGELVLDTLECPNKSGKWYSYIRPNDERRDDGKRLPAAVSEDNNFIKAPK